MYVCMYVCMHACVYKFHSKLKYALIPLQCSLNVDVEVELTHGTRLGMYGLSDDSNQNKKQQLAI